MNARDRDTRESLYDVEARINRAIEMTLKTDVVQYVQRIFPRFVQTEIYDKSHRKENAWVGGKTYERRFALSKEPMSYTYQSEPDYFWNDGMNVHTLKITSTASSGPSILGYPTHGDDGWFLDLLEEGDLGFYDHYFPRPVVPVVQDYLDKDPELQRIINKGLSENM